MAKENKKDQGDFQGGVYAKDGEKASLGDVAVVQSILRDSASDILLHGESAITEASRLADVFLGKDVDDFILVPGWNMPEGIDYVIGRWFGVGHTPEETMVSFFSEFYLELNTLANYAASPGVTSDLWKDQVDALVEQYALYLVGVGPQTQSTA